MKNIEELRKQAERARRLASQMTNDAERARLLTFATELHAESDRLEADLSDRGAG